MPTHTQEAAMTKTVLSDLSGKSVIVTGGGSGIGAEIVRRFAEQKAKVGFVDIQAEASRDLAAELNGQGGIVAFEHCDIRDIAALRSAIASLRNTLGPITILCNNAAHDERHDTMSVTSEQFDEKIAVNLKHAYFASQAVIPDMKAAGGGTIINFGSISWMIGSENLSVYATAKSAAHGLTRVLAREFGADNIRVNCVVPGWIMTQRQIDKWLTPEGERQILERQCLKRKLVPDDIAKAVLFLASDLSSGMTNQTLVIDGGWV
jgi:NAD(P)-dependent dehydrogenase (short-subunit alcohol dehydrogenase family)